MGWITVEETWNHVEGLIRTTNYPPGKYNVTGEVAAAFAARNKTDGDAHHPDAESGSGSPEGDADTNGVGEAG